MIEEQATVVSCDGDYASVTAGRKAACGGCSNEPSCGTSLLAKTFGNRSSEIRALNSVGAKPGERVVLGLNEDAVLRSAFLLYAVPLLCFLFAAILGHTVAEQMQLNNAELTSIVLGLLGLWGGLIIVKRYANRLNNDKAYQAVIIRRQAETYITLKSASTNP